MKTILTADRVLMADSAETISTEYYMRGWTDGLPIIPPTEKTVVKMLSGTKRDPAKVVAIIPPKMGEATVERIAINAVMAGCLPEYLPLIVTGIEAMSDSLLNLDSMQATTYPVSFVWIVNGPVRKELGINGGSGAFGSGWRSNVSIARAMRLILLNIGGAQPGRTDMSTQGKHTFCIAENEEASPWEPLHIERGFDTETSTVTVVAAENPHNINDHQATMAEEVLTTIAGTMATVGTNNIRVQLGEPILALCPEHAATIAGENYSKNDIKAYLHEKARIPLSRFHKKMIERHYPDLAEDALIPITAKKEDIMVIIVGGPGKHSSFLPTFGFTRSVTRAIL